jgi:hypothetical protein
MRVRCGQAALFQDPVILADRTLLTGSTIKGHEANIVAVACLIQPPRGFAVQNNVSSRKSVWKEVHQRAFMGGGTVSPSMHQFSGPK